MTTETRDLTSIGCLAGQMQRSVRSIEQAASRAGIKPAMRIDRVPHYTAAQVERIIAALGGK